MATENCNWYYKPPSKKGQIRSPMISKLGDDLLLEILIRLPNPRSACRCKAVCKLWRSLIADSGFNRRFVFRHQSINKEPLLLPSDDPQSIIRSFVPTPPGFRLVVLDCFKDLILCGFPLSDEHITTVCRLYIICNPFTKQWLPLPLEPLWPTGSSGLATRLVCEPRISTSLDLGNGQAAIYPDYRFRVVCMYNHLNTLKMDVFCSESGEWIKEALVLDDHLKFHLRNVVSYNGELFWCYLDTQELEAGWYNPRLAVLNAFRLDMLPTCIDASALFVNPWWDISISQGALHVFVLEEKPTPGCSRIASHVWRLEQDRKSWSKVCEGVLKSSRCDHQLVWTREEGSKDWMKQCERTSRGNHDIGVKEAPLIAALEKSGLFKTSRCNYELESIAYSYLHPEKPEIVFFHHFPSVSSDNAILSCDLRRGELEFYSKLEVDAPRWAVFLSRVSCWPTPIPRYEEFCGLRTTEDAAAAPTSPSVIGPMTPSITEECQPGIGGSADHHQTPGVVLRSRW